MCTQKLGKKKSPLLVILPIWIYHGLVTWGKHIPGGRNSKDVSKEAYLAWVEELRES